jgi:hypothetical protein
LPNYNFFLCFQANIPTSCGKNGNSKANLYANMCGAGKLKVSSITLLTMILSNITQTSNYTS